MTPARDNGHILVPVGLFAGIALLIAADLASDYRAGYRPLHLIMEVLAGGLALTGTALFGRHAWSLHKAAEGYERDLRAKDLEAQEWREEARHALEGMGSAIDREFATWGLTDAERDVALQLLKGLSHKEIANRRRTVEGTVRQQALAIYRKAGVGGRYNLAAFFLDGLTLPRRIG